MTEDDAEAIEAIRACLRATQDRLRELAGRHLAAVLQSIAYRALGTIDVMLDAVADLASVLRERDR